MTTVYICSFFLFFVTFYFFFDCFHFTRNKLLLLLLVVAVTCGFLSSEIIFYELVFNFHFLIFFVYNSLCCVCRCCSSFGHFPVARIVLFYYFVVFFCSHFCRILCFYFFSLSVHIRKIAYQTSINRKKRKNDNNGKSHKTRYCVECVRFLTQLRTFFYDRSLFAKPPDS